VTTLLADEVDDDPDDVEEAEVEEVGVVEVDDEGFWTAR
jgi:hypothetical protein